MGKEETKAKKEGKEEDIKAEASEGNKEQTPDQKLAELQTKLDEANDKHLRLYSEFDNYRKRTAKEKIDWIKTAGEETFKSLLPVIDDFERAIKSNNETADVEALKEGVNLIYSKLKNTLAHKGLEEMKSIGTEFNPDMHEAITNAEAPSDDMKGKVIEELEKGYLLNGKIIRYAKVVIGS